VLEPNLHSASASSSTTKHGLYQTLRENSIRLLIVQPGRQIIRLSATLAGSSTIAAPRMKPSLICGAS
jgi:hypothetical protein